jgi:hypothetical protein
MRLQLNMHPNSQCSALTGVEAEAVRRGPHGLELRCVARGRIGALALPAPAAPDLTHDLWQHTCFEAFVRAPGDDEPYYELNLAPSTRWAAYRFGSYREGMTVADAVVPRIEVTTGDETLELRAWLELPELPPLSAWRIGLAAVIEQLDGQRSYWALHHAPGRPDFHHPDEFAYELAPVESL